jgi:lysophospholipase L1-like esterase
VTRIRSAPFIGFATLVLAVVSLSACDTAPNQYVALGDSYTSGAGIPANVGQGCDQSDHSYPYLAHDTLVGAGVAVPTFFDFSCSGATTADMYQAQVTSDGTNLPQLDSVSSRAKVVTVGIGGNDIGFSDILQSCLKVVPALQADCKPDYVHDGIDELRNRVDDLAPTIATLIGDIRERAPLAAIFIVGYPTILPTDSGCWPTVPISAGDVTYLSGIEQYLNAMLQTQAQANGAFFVDTATSSIGHDACAGGSAWVNGVTLDNDGAMFHPNTAGAAHTAELVAAAIDQQVD